MIDIVDFFSGFYIGEGTKNFYKMSSEDYPIIWETTYNILDNPVIKRFLFGIRYPIFQEKFDDIITQYKPDEVISVFPFWGGFIKKNIQKYGKDYTSKIVITDSVYLHSIWYVKGDYIDKYFVIDNYSQSTFYEKFKPKHKNVIVSFFPIENPGVPFSTIKAEIPLVPFDLSVMAITI